MLPALSAPPSPQAFCSASSAANPNNNSTTTGNLPEKIREVYFKRFSKVAEDKLVRYTREKPYSAVRIKLFGKLSQGTTCPWLSALAKNSRVRLEVLVLSISKIPITELSRTAKSLPIDRYNLSPPVFCAPLLHILFPF